MNYDEIYNDLKALRVKAFALSKKDKEFIRETSKSFNIDFNERGSSCVDCYRDQIIILSIAAKKHLTIVENETTGYKMVTGKSIKWRQIKWREHVINNETITDEIAEKFISNVKNWFIFIEKK